MSETTMTVQTSANHATPATRKPNVAELLKELEAMKAHTAKLESEKSELAAKLAAAKKPGKNVLSWRTYPVSGVLRTLFLVHKLDATAANYLVCNIMALPMHPGLVAVQKSKVTKFEKNPADKDGAGAIEMELADKADLQILVDKLPVELKPAEETK